MNSSARASVVAAVLGVLLFDAAPAFPQAPQLPPGGLFGGGADRGGRHKLDFSLSVVEAHDSDAPPELGGIAPVDTLVSGYSTMVMGNGEYRWQGSRVQIGATGASALRYYSQADVRSVSHNAGLGLSARLGGRTTLLVNQTAAYSPSSLYGLFPRDAVSSPGDAVSAPPDYAIFDSESYSYGTTLALTHGLTRRSRLSAAGEYQYTDFRDETTVQRDVSSQGIRGEFSRNLARNTAMRVGYRYRTGTFGYGAGGLETERDGSTTEHGLDVGMEYSRPFSATRRLVLGGSFGSSAVDIPWSVDEGPDPGRLYRLSSDIAIAWQFGRMWQARGTFRRGLEFLAALSEPVFADSVTAELGGLVTSRLDVSGSVRYSSGGSALDRQALTFDTYGADLRIRYALSRALAVYGEYLYYYYDFQGDTQLAPGIPSGLERKGVRAGLTLWVPALRR